MAPIVRVRHPRCTVRVVSHRFGEIPADVIARSLLDVSTSWRMGDPAGSFQFALAPPAPRGLGLPRQRWEDCFDPMDYVEIQMWEPPRPPRVVLRGFIDAVGEVFQMSDTAPQRRVIVAGRNYGKLLQISKLWYWSDKTEAQRIAILRRWNETYNKLLTRAGDGAPGEMDQVPMEGRSERYPTSGPVFTPQEAMTLIYDGFYVPQEDAVLGTFSESAAVPRLDYISEIESDDVALVMFSPLAVPLSWEPYQDIWSMFRAYQHHPWRELFIQEMPSRPLLVYRPTPWLTREGEPAQPWGVSVVTHQITLDRQSGWSLFRSDADVKNFFFVYAGEMAAYAQAIRNLTGPLEGAATPGLASNPHLIQGGNGRPNSYERFGVRLHEVQSPYLNFERGWKEGVVSLRSLEVKRQGVADCQRLVKALGHAEMLERGTFVIPGDERLDIGHYAQVVPYRATDGPVDLSGTAHLALYYIEGLQQHVRFGPGVEDIQWTSRLDVTRGRGHIAREDALADSGTGYL